MNTTRRLPALAAILLSCAPSLLAAEPTGDASAVLEIPNLVAFWTFGEPAGAARESIVSGAVGLLATKWRQT